jgi:chorismate mutase
MNKTLNDLRSEIDALDDELIQIIANRTAIVNEIGKLKKQNNIKPLDEKRWEEVLNRVLENAKKNNISKELIKKIYDQIHKAALEIEK